MRIELNDLVATELGDPGYDRINALHQAAPAPTPAPKRAAQRGPELTDKQITHTASVHRSTTETIFRLLSHYAPMSLKADETGAHRVDKNQFNDYIRREFGPSFLRIKALLKELIAKHEHDKNDKNDKNEKLKIQLNLISQSLDRLIKTTSGQSELISLSQFCFLLWTLDKSPAQLNQNAV